MRGAALWFDVGAIPDPTLVPGARTAWAHKLCLRTSGLSEIHRVGAANTTMCGQWMPDACCHVPIAGLSLRTCERCENAYAREVMAGRL